MLQKRFLCRALLQTTSPALLRLSSPSEAEVANDAPVFLLSAGWRSGSTLVQRLICSDPNILMWGEPMEDRLVVPRLHATLEHYSENDAHIKYAIDEQAGELSSQWIANLNPGYPQLLLAHRAFYDVFFAKPSKTQGRSRWGVKSVRLTAYHAKYLQLLYPKAKFVFLVRDPVESWASYRGKKWFTSYPDFRMDNIFKFVAHWKYLTASFLQCAQKMGSMILKYEDLIESDVAVSSLESHLELNFDRSVIERRIGSSFQRGGKNVNYLEKKLARRLAGEPAKTLGY